MQPHKAAEKAKEEPTMEGGSTEAAGMMPISTPIDREKYAAEVAESNPGVTMNQLREQLVKRFNRGIGNARLGEILRDVKEKKGLVAAKPTRPLEMVRSSGDDKALAVRGDVSPNLVSIVRGMRALGIVSIRIHPDGSVKWEERS